MRMYALTDQLLLEDFTNDLNSRKDWLETYVDGLELLGLKIEERSEPWEGACAVYYEGWQSAAQKLNQNGLEMHMFVTLCGFGSTLMDYSSTTGVAISLTGESGAAKTGALYSALSIWGKPKKTYLL